MTTESRRDSFRRFPRRRFATSLSIDTPESSRTKPLPLRRSNQIYTCTSRSLRPESGSVFLIAFFHLRCTSTTLRRALRLFCLYCCCFLLLLFVAFLFGCVCSVAFVCVHHASVFERHVEPVHSCRDSERSPTEFSVDLRTVLAFLLLS